MARRYTNSGRTSVASSNRHKTSCDTPDLVLCRPQSEDPKEFTVPQPPIAAKATHFVVLLDRSGSMESIAGDVIGGYNAFINEQRANGADAAVTLVQFDSQNAHDLVYDRLPIAEVPSLTAKTFIPRANTPLFDATGRLVATVREQRAVDSRAAEHQPDVVFVTITDGHENDSTEFTLERVRELITKCESEGWTFVYLSADLNAYGDARGLGVRGGRARAFKADKGGVDAMFSNLSSSALALREKKRRGLDTRDDDFFDDEKVNRLLGDDED